MKTEELLALGITEEQAKSILVINGKDIESSKAKFSDYDDLKTQLSEANKQIQAFKEMDIDGIKKAADDWKVKAETAEKEAQSKLERLQFDHALDSALGGAKAKNPKAVRALLDMEGLKLNGEEVVGLKEQLEKIKTDNDYLFEGAQEKVPQIVKGTGGNPPPLTDVFTMAARRAAGLKID